jgi:hypothetical protein
MGHYGLGDTMCPTIAPQTYNTKMIGNHIRHRVELHEVHGPAPQWRATHSSRDVASSLGSVAQGAAHATDDQPLVTDLHPSVRDL